MIQPKVPLPEKGIIVRRSGKHLYVYKVTSTYRTEKGNPTNTRVSIGKLDDTKTRLYPNKSYWRFYNATLEVAKEEIQKANSFTQYESIKSIGATFLFGNVVREGVYACSVKDWFFGAVTNMHIYYDPAIAKAKRQDLYKTVQNEEKVLSSLECLKEKEAKIEMGSASVLQIYRRKDVIEKGFDEIKNYKEMKRLRTHNTKTTDGKMFCAFIALIAVLKLTRFLSDYMKAKSVSKDGIVSELNKIRIITLPNGMRLLNPITKLKGLYLKIAQFRRTICFAISILLEDFVCVQWVGNLGFPCLHKR